MRPRNKISQAGDNFTRLVAANKKTAGPAAPTCSAAKLQAGQSFRIEPNGIHLFQATGRRTNKGRVEIESEGHLNSLHPTKEVYPEEKEPRTNNADETY